MRTLSAHSQTRAQEPPFATQLNLDTSAHTLLEWHAQIEVIATGLGLLAHHVAAPKE